MKGASMTHVKLLERKVKWAERKANEAAASSDPWALGNLRLYQNMMVKFLDELNAAKIAKREARRKPRGIETFPNYAIIIRSIHERGASQEKALKELLARGLWLTHEQKEQAGLIDPAAGDGGSE